jgi:hypothetical protein
LSHFTQRDLRNNPEFAAGFVERMLVLAGMRKKAETELAENEGYLSLSRWQSRTTIVP